MKIGDNGDNKGNIEGDLLHHLQLYFFLFAFVSMPRLKGTMKPTFPYFQSSSFLSFSIFTLSWKGCLFP